MIQFVIASGKHWPNKCDCWPHSFALRVDLRAERLKTWNSLPWALFRPITLSRAALLEPGFVGAFGVKTGGPAILVFI